MGGVHLHHAQALAWINADLLIRILVSRFVPFAQRQGHRSNDADG
jgi:hypothetical protein